MSDARPCPMSCIPLLSGHPRRARRTRRATGLALAATLLVALPSCSGDDGAAPDTTTGTTVAPPSTTTTEAPMDAGERVYVFAPEVGDCFDRRTLSEEEGGEEIILLLDCELPHEVEVFAVSTIDVAALPVTSTTTTTAAPTTTSTTTSAPTVPGGATTTTTLDPGQAIGADDGADDEPGSEDWPGEDALERYAKRRCAAAFDPWAGIPYELSALEIAWIVPDEPEWQGGDRTLVCTAYDPTGTAEAPVRLSGSMAGAGR